MFVSIVHDAKVQHLFYIASDISNHLSIFNIISHTI